MSFQAYTQQPCVPCIKCELDLESVLPLQISVVDDYLVRTSPKSGPESGGPLEFLILTSGDDYLNLSHCYLYLKCRVLKDDGMHIETLKANATHSEDTSMGPLNLLFYSIFRQMDLVMNDALVAMRHLPLQSLPDNAAQLWTWFQWDLVKAPGSLVHGQRG